MLRFRLLAAAAVAIACTCAMEGDLYAARSLRVRGTARIDGHAGRSHGRLLLEGRVVDDAGAPVPSAAVTVAVTPAAPGAAPGAALELAGLVAPCGADRPAAVTDLRTDESGRYCAWIAVPVGSYAIHLEAGPTPWLARAAADESADLAKRSVRLRFDPEPRILSLDAGRSSLDAVATYDDDDGSGAAGATGLPLVLTTETNAVVAEATTGAGGRATFAIDAASLGAPGRGALHLRFAGDDATMASEHLAPVERDAHVGLVQLQPVAPCDPEDGVAVQLGASVRAPGAVVPTGSVEARLDGVIVGAATIDARGRAVLRATFAPRGGGRTGAAELQVRYVPDAPWFQPAGDLTVHVPVRGPSPLRQLPLAVGALAVAAWLLAGRSARRGRLDRTLAMERPPTHEGTAGVSVVQSSRSRSGAYSGRVVDAHDGSPVARARVSVQTPTFPGVAPGPGPAPEVLASVFADEEGAFAFELSGQGKNLVASELVVEAPLHADLRQKLPGPGVLEIALVSRRRRLLERLVQWARRRGPPYDVRPEPTPGQVRRAAQGRRGDASDRVGPWADAIEQAAYDRGDVDARVEAEVMALDPDDASGRPDDGPDAPPAPRPRGR